MGTSLRAAGFAVDVATGLPTADGALGVNSYDCVVFDRCGTGPSSSTSPGTTSDRGWRTGSHDQGVRGAATLPAALGRPVSHAELLAGWDEVVRPRPTCSRSSSPG